MRFSIALVLALLTLAAPQSAHAWWNNDWGFRKKINIDSTAAGGPAAALAQVPILIRLHAGNFSFVDTQENGADLRVIAADDKTPLPFHIERYDWVDGLAYVWVQIPSLGAAGSPPFIWIYYGNPTAPAAGNGKAVWDPTQTLVFHFADKELIPQDATAFGNNSSQSTATPVATGQIDAAAQYSGTAITTVPASPSLKLAAKGGFTFTAWVKSDVPQSAVLFQEVDGKRSLTIALDNDQPVARLIGDDGKTIATPAKARLAPGTWHHLAVTASDRLVVSIDGAEVSAIAASLPDLAGALSIGGTASPGTGFKGLLDEVRLSNQARSADWLKLEVQSESPDSTLVSFGEDEQGKSDSGNEYLAIIGVLAGAVSVDGWIVIGLIGLLGFISGEVAISKALMLRRAVRANDRFLVRFRGKDADPLAGGGSPALAVGDPGEWKDSPLYSVYAAGAEELGRLREAQGETRRFNNFSLEVVRAAVDSSVIQQANRINDKMVLLTLAVSGAPFLGLLGTVVGIMITFATIALKGDVNINTIAPGIAAAITATAAGMLVAIPALFGYNVLMTKIKEVTTVMETFRDELLSKIAARFA